MINGEDIHRYIKTGESQYVEFKRAEHKFPKSALETICAFSNSNGGVLLLGIDEDKGEIAGVTDSKKIISKVFNHMNNTNEINRNVLSLEDVYVVDVEGKEVVVIEVDAVKFTNKPIYLKNNPAKTYIRQGEGDYLADEDILQMMYRDASRESADSKLLEDYTLEDLDDNTILEYRGLWRKIHPFHPFNNLETKEFLKKINVLKTNRKSNKECLTLAGLLVFGKHESIKEYLPHYNVEYIRKSIESLGSSYDDRLIYDGTWDEDNLYNFFFNTFNKIILTINDSSKISTDSLLRTSTSKMKIAIREALVNSIIHCDFLSPKGIQVIRYSDKIVFENGGGLRISIQDFFAGGCSEPRNYYIQEIFRLVNICEKAGTGIPKIMEAVKEYTLRFPDVTQEIDYFRFILWDMSILEYLEVSNDTERKIVEYIIKNKWCLRLEIEKELDIAKSTAIKYLNKLIEKNILLTKRNGRHMLYMFNDQREGFEKYHIINHMYSLIEEFKRQ